MGVPMARLIELISGELERVVLDKTAFANPFKFRLEFASDMASPPVNADPSAAASSPGLSIFTALEEQLGLRLRSATGPVEVGRTGGKP
jgi:uncharacterized protein (TIGR03435 family)